MKISKWVTGIEYMNYNKPIKIGFIEVSHWHSVGYLEIIKKIPFAKIIAVSDKNEKVAKEKGDLYAYDREKRHSYDV